MALNDTQDLEAELRQVSVEYSDLDLNRKLQRAANRRVREVGKRFVQRKRIEFEDETEVDLDFQSLESFDKVVNVNGEGNEIVDSGNYTEDLDNAIVDFSQSYVDDDFFEGLILKFYYVPSDFKDLELDLAKRNILEDQTIQTTDGVNNTQTDRLNQRIAASIRRINSKNGIGVQSGDNINRGSENVKRSNGGS